MRQNTEKLQNNGKETLDMYSVSLGGYIVPRRDANAGLIGYIIIIMISRETIIWVRIIFRF